MGHPHKRAGRLATWRHGLASAPGLIGLVQPRAVQPVDPRGYPATGRRHCPRRAPMGLPCNRHALEPVGVGSPRLNRQRIGQFTCDAAPTHGLMEIDASKSTRRQLALKNLQFVEEMIRSPRSWPPLLGSGPGRLHGQATSPAGDHPGFSSRITRENLRTGLARWILGFFLSGRVYFSPRGRLARLDLGIAACGAPPGSRIPASGSWPVPLPSRRGEEINQRGSWDLIEQHRRVRRRCPGCSLGCPPSAPV